MNMNDVLSINNALQRALIPVVEMMDTDERINFYGAWLDVIGDEGEQLAMVTFHYKPAREMQEIDFSAFKDDMLMVSQLLAGRDKALRILGISDKDGAVRMVLGLE